MSQHEQSERKDIGALWKKTSKSGQAYLSGQIDGRRIVIFANKWKESGDKKPDYRIYEEAVREAVPSSPLSDSQQPVAADDIPF